jgi:hypothetical protein
MAMMIVMMVTMIMMVMMIVLGRDSSVGIATRYVLECPGMESRWVRAGPYLRTGHRGPGSGRHIKKIEIEVWYVGEKGCPREINLREIYTENNVGTTARQSFLVTTLLALGAIMFCLLSVFRVVFAYT